MALSDWDQFRLREIEEHTRATDPEFVTRLDLAGVLRRDHLDYLHNGHWHAPHDGHYDEHPNLDH